MTPQGLHPRLDPILGAIEELAGAAVIAARAARKRHRAARRPHHYAALQPGPDTPLWNELVNACARELTRYGDKARLGRILGVPRQRIHTLLVAKSACADAERTLRLLTWLQARRRDRERR